MKDFRHFIALVVFLTCLFGLEAQTGTGIKFSDNGIAYHILSLENKTVETSKGSAIPEDGHLSVPATVNYNGEQYTVVQIGWWSFESCSNLKTIDLPETLVEIRTSAFTYSGLTEINLPHGLRSIDGFAFAGCRGLKEVVLPEGLLSVGDCGFFNSGLESVVFPHTLTNLGENSFSGTSLKSAEIFNVKKIGNGAFWNTELQELVLHEGLEQIGDRAFNSRSLQEVRLPSTIKYLGMWAFYGGVHDLYVPCHTPPSVNGSDSWHGGISHTHIPKGTLKHYQCRAWKDHWTNLVEDDSLGRYCDINRDVIGSGCIDLDMTGVITNADGFHFVNAGSDVTLTIKPGKDYLIAEATLNSIDFAHDLGYDVTLYEDIKNLDLSDSLTTEVAYVVNNVQDELNVHVAFAKTPYTRMALRQGEGGTLTVRMHRGETVSLQLETEEGTDLEHVSINGLPALVNDCQVVVIPDLEDPIGVEIEYKKH